MNTNKRFKLHIGTQICRIFLIIYSCLAIFPIVWVFMSSLKTNRTLFDNLLAPPPLNDLNWINYVDAWERARVSTYFFNTVAITFLSLVCLMLFASMAAYVLARYSFRGNKAITFLYISGLMIPGVIGIIPLYLLLSTMNLLDNRGALVIMNLVTAMPFSVFLLIAFFKTIPKEISEAGVIDGCNHFNLFSSVILPLAKPGLIPVLIIGFMSFWSEVYYSMILIHTDSKRTLQVGLMNMQRVQFQAADWVVMYAAVIIVILPSILLYIIFQKKIVEGVNMGAIKG